MEIIKDAFVEGRETDTEWEKSDAKKNQVKAEIALENFSTMKKREFRSIMPLHQICPDTGKILNTFPSRLAAAKFIVTHILKRPDKNPISITGNMEICMRLNYKAYGFYWKIATQDSITNNSNTPDNARKIFVAKHSDISKPKNAIVYPSIAVTAKALNVSEDVIRNSLKPNRTKKNKGIYGTFVQEYNPTKQIKNFNTIEQAAKWANSSFTTMKQWAEHGTVVNNYIYDVASLLNKPSDYKYTLYNRNKLVGRYNSIAEIAAITGGHRTKIAIKIKNNIPLGDMKQYRVTVK